MNSKSIRLLWTGVTVWISLLLMITTTYGGSIVIGGNYTNIGTIVIVSPKPGDTPLANGTALLNNLAAITADVNNPYVIKLGPGIYDIGINSLQMKAYIDVEGSGENTTIITGHSDTLGVVRGASNAEIRFLSVQNTGGGTSAAAIYNTSASPNITNVTASASGGTQNYGVVNDSSSPTMTNVTASASGATYNHGVYSSSTGTILINNSVIIGSAITVYNGSNTTTRIGNTKLDGGPVSNVGTLTCVGAYNGNYVALGVNCQ